MCASYGTRWRAREDRSPRATPRRPLRSLYRRARRTSSSFSLSLLVVSLSLCVSLSTRVSSLPAFCFRLCRRSAFVPAGASSLRFVSAYLAFCTRLCYRLYSRLSHSCLGYASRSSRALLHRQQIYRYICNMYEHFNQLIELASFLACLLI